MKDLYDIVRRANSFEGDPSDAVVATIVRTLGSSYRRAGAKILIEPDGAVTGVLSGGCLESDLTERAKAVRATKRPDLITYDTSSPKDIVDGLGIGCNGTVQVLIEPWEKSERALRFASNLIEQGRRGVIATVFHLRGFPDVSLGARALIDDKAASTSNLPEGTLRHAIVERGREHSSLGATAVETLHVGEESADVLFDVVAPPLSLIIFGAGPGSPALARIAKSLGWRITVIDNRDKASYQADFACADQKIIGDVALIGQSLRLSPGEAAVVMSHNFASDLEYLKLLAPSPVHYIGLLGSRTRSEELLAALSEAGIPSDSVRKRLFNPVGLDIGAEGPEEIALAILAEIRAVASGRNGGFLRDRKGSIHERGSSDIAR